MGKWAGRLFYNFGLQRRALTPCLYMPIPSVHLPRWAWVSHTQKEVTPWAQVLRAARAHSLAHLHIVCTMPHSAGGWAWERSPSRQLSGLLEASLFPGGLASTHTWMCTHLLLSLSFMYFTSASTLNSYLMQEQELGTKTEIHIQQHNEIFWESLGPASKDSELTDLQ